MRILQSPALLQRTDQIIGVSGALRSIMQNIYLDTNLTITCASKTLSKDSCIVAPNLFITASSKTLVLCVGVPNLVMSLVAASKTLSKDAVIVTMVPPSVDTVHITCSTKTLSKTQVILTTITVAERIRRNSAVLLTREFYAKLL